MNDRFPLYDSRFEHDACGTGFVAKISGAKSHDIIRKAITSVCNLTHRGAVAADTQTGDGAGILSQLPVSFFLKQVPELVARLEAEDELGVGMFFMPGADEDARSLCRALVEHVTSSQGLGLLGWRRVPVDTSVLGESAALTAPLIEQVFVRRPRHISPTSFERTLYACRKEIEKHMLKTEVRSFYVCSFSGRTIIYKGLMIATALDTFFPDLKDEMFTSAFAVYHQRYSTNTFPTWGLAQPFRMLAHNGEINTIQGNRVWTRAREMEIASDAWGEHTKVLQPILQPGGSDSAHLDNALELLSLSGRNVLHAMMMLVPEAWRARTDISQSVMDFYDYNEGFSEPWDGPAALSFSDGAIVGAVLDRNGLRPVRYKITSDGLIALGSEVGALELKDEFVVERGRLEPGQMIAVDTARGVLLRDLDIKEEMASHKPYSAWLRNLKRMPVLTVSDGVDDATSNPKRAPAELAAERTRLQLCFGYSAEELALFFKPMAAGDKVPVGSMGDDASLAILSRFPKLLPSYFRQQFAQVTNPPIDPLRERLVMSLTSKLGYRRNWLGESPEHAKLVELQSPFIFAEDLQHLRSIDDSAFRAVTLQALFPVCEGEEGLEPVLSDLCLRAERAGDEGMYLVILSDRGVCEDLAPVPILLAIGAVQNHLLRVGKRLKLSVVAETGEPRDVHHFATLIGYGANAVHPYLAIDTVRAMASSGELGSISSGEACRNFRKSVDSGILKVMSKMGISLLGSYRGSQNFEAVGISSDVVERYFTGTPTRIEGLGLRDIAREALARHERAFGGAVLGLVDEGQYRFRKNGERRAWSPEALRSMQSLRTSGQREEYEHFKKAVSDTAPIGIKDLLTFKKLNNPIPLDDVEEAEEIRRRFTTAAMSLGALSPETHETIAVAMNRIGGKSNSGEGGEDPRRYGTLSNGDSANSAIKQVASARFGVTAEYLANAKELEIKMAQGSKPGEGGQIPAEKVTALIARLRKAVPGISLISPPPHHDIYSIEDLAQLIYDLKQVNPRARVCVKLVSEAGVGTIAAGVAKAYADVILISGHDGGTGASPLSSIKNAGSPWELGLAEAQQVLVMNGLRERVMLRVDGGLKTGRDIVIAAMLGAEEFNFGTAALIALGCRYVRQCHLNTCPVGIATQDERLRSKFEGKPEMLINYLTAVAEDVRQTLADLGFRSLHEVVGRTDLLKQRTITDHPKANTVDLGGILARRDYAHEQRFRVWHRNDRPDRPLDITILHDVQEAIREKRHVVRKYRIRNINRSVSSRLSGEIAFLYGDRGLPPKTIELCFEGSAGQSFGAFLVEGVSLTLVGEANDYVGKGMSGGEIAVMTSGTRAHGSSEVIMGNTVLYGATGGALFACGRAGERFAVRNSGALAVVEGIGNHGCEYMTQGTVVILGSTGRNFGAGMTGGTAYVLDSAGDFGQRINPELVEIVDLDETEDGVLLRSILYRHLVATNSAVAQHILTNWNEHGPKFRKVQPKSRAVVPLAETLRGQEKLVSPAA
ncbi:MAG: glutamate synthase subunit alpha [Ignavibacteria bacterium GWC2_56_12]|nr:MAG: glutamate synthase subunit alpha [Ignavibacteria bacterium GWC2_56_12]